MTAACPKPADHTLPDGWQRVRLGDVAEVVGGSTPSRKEARYWGGDVPWVVPSELTALKGRYLSASKESITDEGMRSAGLRLIPAGSILLTSRATVGVTAINGVPIVTNQGFQNLIVKNGADPLWLYYCVSQQRPEFERRASGSTFLEVSRDSVRSLPILLPPLPEQRAIAAVLDSIDDAIEGAEAVIAATEGLRDALLHDLLTRGLPGQHTEWREVPGLGTIPADWEVARLGDVAEVQTGRAVKKESPVDGTREIPYLSVANVKDGYLDLSVVKTMRVSEGEAERFSLKHGDVLFTEGGDADKLGRGTVWRTEISMCLHQNHVFAVRPHYDVLTSEFLSFFAGSGLGKRYFLGAAKQTTNLASVNSTQLKDMTLPLPDIREQKDIVAVLGRVGTTTEVAREAAASLRLLKESAADALLSGRVRVLSELMQTAEKE